MTPAKQTACKLFTCGLLLLSATSCSLNKIAHNFSINNSRATVVDWRYGASEIRIQTCKATRTLIERWLAKTSSCQSTDCPRIIITKFKNCTDCYIPCEMIRDAVEEAALDDGRFTILMCDPKSEQKLTGCMSKTQRHPKYRYPAAPSPDGNSGPKFFGKICLTKISSTDPACQLEEYHLALDLYDAETEELVDSAQDILYKKAYRH